MGTDYTAPLHEYDIEVDMHRQPGHRAGETRTFTARIPAIDEATAIKGAVDLGHCVNVASGYQWKFTGGEGGIRARRAEEGA